MECGIYPEGSFFHVKIGMILIGSKRIQEDPELPSLRFTGSYLESLGCMERKLRRKFSLDHYSI